MSKKVEVVEEVPVQDERGVPFDALDADVEIARETMLGDLMKVCLDEIRAAPDVWPKLSQEKQEDVIDRVERRVSAAVREAVEIIAAKGRIAIAATLEQVTVKDGIKAVVTLSRSDSRRHELIDACGQNLLLVVADATEHMGGAGVHKPEPDQPGLPIEDAVAPTFTDPERDALAGAGFQLSEAQLAGLSDEHYRDLMEYVEGLVAGSSAGTVPAWLDQYRLPVAA